MICRVAKHEHTPSITFGNPKGFHDWIEEQPGLSAATMRRTRKRQG